MRLDNMWHRVGERGLWSALLGVAILLMIFALPQVANAGALDDVLGALGGIWNQLTGPKCTWNLSFWMPNTILPMVQGIIYVASLLVENAMEDLFLGILEYGTDAYATSLAAAGTLFVLFYGIAFLFGIANFTAYEAILRLAKLGIVMTFLTPTAWDIYQLYFVDIFHYGVQNLIEEVVDIGKSAITVGGAVGVNLTTGGISIAIMTGISAPLAMFADIVTMALSPRMMVIFLTCFGTAPYGVPMGLALGYGIYQILAMFFRVVEVYGLSIIVRAVLLGLGPIFFAFFLFKKTNSLFLGWFNQLISFSLQPILMFAFLSFFIPMLESSMNAVAPRGIVEACYVSKQGVSGSEVSPKAWRFALLGFPYQGDTSKEGTLIPPLGLLAGWLNAFPINPMALVVFIIVTYTARQLVDVAAELGNDLASGTYVLSRQ